ncbi:IclR family transcriptional regulator [Desulfosarcina cetonica]|uniref:IclR family transcriptional regulator n=1 Tax=Desulfosarcina cetonica TaxID=90730 RepID=UPI0006D16EA3|nr:IclR family transcriptional regulator [Desulfosarcina cetonica]
MHKAFQILKTVAQSSESLGLVQLSELLGYSKSTTHGLVHALLREGVLTQGLSGRKLFLGPMIAELMFSTWDQEKVLKLAQPILDEIRDTVNETVILGARIRHRVLIISIAEAFDSLKISVPIGSTIPLIAGAVGKALLATERPELVGTLIQKYGLRTYTPRSITDIGAYMAELERVRQQGVAIDIEEYLSGIKAVAVALGNLQGLPIAIWVVGMSANIDDDKLAAIATITKTQAEHLRQIVDHASFN